MMLDALKGEVQRALLEKEWETITIGIRLNKPRPNIYFNMVVSISGASQGKGRGRQVIAVARTADLVVMMLDALKGEVQKALLEKEWETITIGIRLNKPRPNIYFNMVVSISGASQGKGRGRQVIAVARTADLVVMMLDALKGEVQKALLEKEWETITIGIRLNKPRPNIYFNMVVSISGASQGKGRGRQVIAVARTADLVVMMMLDALKGEVQKALLQKELETAGIRLNKPKPNTYFNMVVSISGASQGKGRGRQVIAVARTADLVVMMLDALKGEVQKTLLEKELETVGIRLNKPKPDIYFKIKKSGGLQFNSTLNLTKCNEKLVQLILHEYKIFNAEVVFREDASMDDFIDVLQANRVYMRCIYVYNKIDQVSIEEIDRLAHLPNSIVISCNMKLNLDYFLEVIWEALALVRIYTKKPGEAPELGPEAGLILRAGATVEHACHAVHRTLATDLKYAIVWGTSTKFSPQRVGLHHKLDHEDVIQIIKK